ncbi:uncharacterized protein FPRO_12850 [Fusarium proliferatum ET1]|uniref:Uncharacterized protein n=1 Tax=Fusarium proliferatum (strain ET1) TaxID=1227346 RepID=A0A1L7W6L4_FUSPR|nr:uncharacterized protein FPRO_12850 [Fusarium proliferatum ET1]CZR48240.1 uncharacterized protein FPRO_12850 [Fusarium proliferatum ET1]
MVATLVSKRLRSVLLPQCFKTLKFSGSLKRLAHDMTSFLSGDLKHLMMTLLPVPKSVTIRFEPYSRAEERTDLHLSTHRIAVISKFISKLSSIDLISFGNQIKDEIDFAEGLGNTPKWNGPKSAIFCSRRNLLIFSALIKHFAPNTVKSVELPRLTAKNHPLALKSAFPFLKWLKADLTSFKTRSRTLACMSSKLIQRFNYDFPHLEVLILDQLDVGAFLWRRGRIYKKSQLPNLNEYVEELITRLKSMPRLRRFAFSLQEDWLCHEYDCDMFHRVSSPSGDESDDPSKSESDDPMQATLEPNEWPYWVPTSAQRKWHSELITRILEAVPQLKELCIVLCTVKLWYKHYRGTKTDGIVTVCQEETCFPETPAQFPYGFADIDWSC